MIKLPGWSACGAIGSGSAGRRATAPPLRAAAPRPDRLAPDYTIARRSPEEAARGNCFPWLDAFQLDDGVVVDADTIIESLTPLLTGERIARIEAACAARTFDVLPILEFPVDWGNVAAICRTADGLGFGALHIVRDPAADERYKQSARTSGGADKWLDVQLFDDTRACLQGAKRAGYRIAVAHVGEGTVEVSEVDWAQPTAVVLGSELTGVSAAALELADVRFAVPMDGFVESFNVSVAAALTLWEARRVRRQRPGPRGELSPSDQKVLKAALLLRSKGLARQYVTNLLQRRPPQWQAQRNRGIWGGREFTDAAGGGEALPLGLRSCHYWDGDRCWGERVLFPGKRCKYHLAHAPGFSTLNRVKLGQRCAALGVAVPPELAAAPTAAARRRAAAALAGAPAPAAAEAAACDAAGAVGPSASM